MEQFRTTRRRMSKAMLGFRMRINLSLLESLCNQFDEWIDELEERQERSEVWNQRYEYVSDIREHLNELFTMIDALDEMADNLSEVD